MRLFPNDSQKEKLQTIFDQFRWYYNSILTVLNLHYGHENMHSRKFYESTERDVFRKYEYTEKIHSNLCFKDFVYDKDKNSIPVPEWWSDKGVLHSRTPRGAGSKLVSSLNSAVSNLRNGNIKHFNMKYRTKKGPTDYVHYEDWHYPSFINEIESKYWFTTRDRKRIFISKKDIYCKKRGCEIIYEKETGKYFLNYPVDIDWYPKDDRRNDNQGTFYSKGGRIISLDPGVRKFLVGYDPEGYSVFIGENCHKELMTLLYQIDKTPISKRYSLWKKVKSLVEELHWKTISFLVRNYDTILLPDFRVSQMVRGRKLARITKRLMMMFSFHSFKTKLQYKCKTYGKNLVIVDESFTSCTCGQCGKINQTHGSEIYHCTQCGLVIDRDVTGSRNIFIKNVNLK